MSLCDDAIAFEQMIGKHCREWNSEHWTGFYKWRAGRALSGELFLVDDSTLISVNDWCGPWRDFIESNKEALTVKDFKAIKRNLERNGKTVFFAGAGGESLITLMHVNA